MSEHRDDVPCIPFDQCPICLDKRQAQRAAFCTADAPLLQRELLGIVNRLQPVFLAERVAYHLSTGCDTPEKARELAMAEWRVGVLGEKS